VQRNAYLIGGLGVKLRVISRLVSDSVEELEESKYEEAMAREG
jgi:hypothetical protein